MLPNSRFGVYTIHTCNSVFKKNTYNGIVEHKIIMIVGWDLMNRLGILLAHSQQYNNKSDVHINSKVIMLKLT